MSPARAGSKGAKQRFTGQIMKYLLGLIAVSALFYGVFSLPEMMVVATRPEATVWQQISARVAIGLSLLIFATSAGLSAILEALHRRERSAAARTEAIIAALGGRSASAEAPTAEEALPRQPSKAEERRQRLAERMGVTLPTEEEEKAALAAQEAGEIKLQSGFVIREKPRTKDALDQAVEQLYKEPPALR